MASVLIPQAQQKQGNGLGTLGALGGMAAGFALTGGTDGGAAAAGGAALGGQLGGTLGGAAESASAKPQGGGAAPIQTGGSEQLNATQRRLAELQNQKTMAQAYNVVQQDPALQKEYGSILKNAMANAQNRTGVA